MRDRMHFSFTPSLLPSNALEALFVQREDLAERVVELTRESAVSEAKYHFLLVGPRGIGKTHMVSIIYHRIKAIKEIQANLLIAWLQEDSWGISSFLDLLVRILQSLVKESHDKDLIHRIEELFELAPEQAEQVAGRLLKEYVGNRTMFLIVENLDELFDGIGDRGQKRLRAYLQENPVCTILATSPSLFNGVSLQTSPFYGFFSVHHLAEFDFDHAHDFLVKIARYKNDKHLTSFLRTLQGRARVRAIHHLAGGNPRVYTIFAQFLHRTSMERLVEPFMRAMDDLTPYYQARMKHLSLQQRKIIELLCERRGAVTVKEIAQRSFITHQTTSSQLKLLREMRYVKATAIGRESYYELNEPLMRISLEVKKHRGEPLRLFVEFLRCWYTRPELENLLGVMPQESKIESQYIRQALNLTKEGSGDPRVASCQKDLKHYKDDSDYEKALKVLDELDALEGLTCENLIERGDILIDQDKFKEALHSFTQAVEINSKQRFAWFGCGFCYLNLQQFEDGVKAFDKAIELGIAFPGIWGLRGVCLQELGDPEEAVKSFKKLTELDPTDEGGWDFMGKLLLKLERFSEASVAFGKVVELNNSNQAAKAYQIVSLVGGGRVQDAWSLCEEYEPIMSEDIMFISMKALVLTTLGRDTEALTCWQEVIDKGDQSLYIRLGKVGSLLVLQRWAEAETSLDEALTNCIGQKSPQEFGTEQLLLVKLFESTQDTGLWRKGINLLIASYAKHGVLFALAAGLARNIITLLSPKVSDTTAGMWRDEWKKAAEGHAEMDLPLRLLDKAIMYRINKDRRALMELPVEERQLIEEMIEKAEHSTEVA